MHPIADEQRGTIYAILAGLSFGLIGYFSMKLIKLGFSVPNAIFWRFLISSICIACFIKTTKTSNTSNGYQEYFKIFFFGFIFCASSSMALLVAAKYIGTGPSMVVFFTFPIFVFLTNKILYNARINAMQYISITFAIVGLALLVNLDELAADVIGIIVGIMSAILYAFFVVSSKSSKLHPAHSTLMICLGVTFCSLCLAFVDNSLSIPATIYSWNICFWYGSLATAIPFLLTLYSLQYIASDKVAILSVLEPVAVVIVGIVLLDEIITIYQTVGIALMLTAAILTAIYPK